jgi:RNA recognition motif-containing protein
MIRLQIFGLISLVISFSLQTISLVYPAVSWRSRNLLKLNQILEDDQGVKFTKIFIGNLPFTVTSDDIKKLIDENVGEGLVREVQLAVGKKSKAPRGFAFVDLIDEEAAMSAASILNEVTYQGRLLNSNIKDDNPNESKRKKTRVNANTVFVTNLDLSLAQSEVIDMCNDIIGPDLVVSLQMPLDKISNKPRGLAYIEFRDAETAQRAITELNGLEVLGRVLVCDKYKPKKVVKDIDEDNLKTI